MVFFFSLVFFLFADCFLPTTPSLNRGWHRWLIGADKTALLGLPPCNFYAHSAASVLLEARLSRLASGAFDGIVKAYRHRETQVCS